MTDTKEPAEESPWPLPPLNGGGEEPFSGFTIEELETALESENPFWDEPARLWFGPPRIVDDVFAPYAWERYSVQCHHVTNRVYAMIVLAGRKLKAEQDATKDATEKEK